MLSHGLRSSATPLLALGFLFGVGAADARSQVAPEPGDLTVTGVNYDENGAVPYTMSISGQEMRMDQGPRSVIFRPTGERPGFLFIDHEARRVDFLPSSTVAAGEAAVSAETAVEYETSPDPLPGLEALAPIPTSVRLIRNGQEEVVPLDLQKIGFHYEGDATLPGMDQAGIPTEMADMIKTVLRIESRASVAPELEGAGTIPAFYEGMAEAGAATPGASFASMSEGLVAVNNQIAAAGFPIWVGSVTRVDVEVEGPMAQMMEGMLRKMPGMGNTLSVSVVESISTDPVDRSLFYDGGMPPDYRVTVLDPGGVR
jgi:hypothetical protein